MSTEAYITLVTNDSYALGALVLANSLKSVGTTRQLAVLITPGVSERMRTLLADQYDTVELVDVINSTDGAILRAMRRPELGVTLTKVHAWRLTQYSKAVFLDADTLVVRNCDELFDRDELSACADIGWPDIFNSGVFVLRPSVGTFTDLVDLAAREGSWDGGDQGLLNSYWPDWFISHPDRHLSFIYNMSLSAVYTYAPAYRRFGRQVKVIHYLGSLKPWQYSYSLKTGSVSAPPNTDVTHHSLDFVQQWWKLFIAKVQPHLTDECAGIARTLAQIQLAPASGEPFVGSQPPSGLIDQVGPDGLVSAAAAAGTSVGAVSGVTGISVRKDNWERGQIDYLGEDSFENIQKKLDESIGLK